MWTAEIKNKITEAGRLRIFITYKNGTDVFEDAIFITSKANLDEAVRSKLAELNQLEVIKSSIPEGAFVPSEKEEVVQDEKSQTLEEISRLKNLINLGVIKETDQEYTDAVTKYKSL